MCRPLLLVAACILLLSGPLRADAPFFLTQTGPKIVFLGDSNTFAGLSIAYLDGFLRTRFPEKRWELINLGLPSETISGLSEADHPYPRPDVHERLDRALAKTRPDVVVICYGMNDGIYAPFSEEHFARYRAGIESVVRRVEKAGAKVVLMTPAPFDPMPLRKVVQPASAAKFSWLRPYEKYDDVLERYSQWLLGWRDQGYHVADPHGAIRRYLAAQRETNPGSFVSGDGIHPNATGHALIALELLRTLHAPMGHNQLVIDASDGFRFIAKARMPMLVDPPWVADQLRLKVMNLEPGSYELREDDKKIGTATQQNLTQGIDLTRWPSLSLHRRAAEFMSLLQKRERLLGLAWLSEVGHQRPDTPKGLPLAEARKQTEVLERRIEELLQPHVMNLSLHKE